MKFLFLFTGLLVVLEQPAWLLEAFEKARLLEKTGQLESAAREYEQIIRRDPSIPEALHNLGLVYYQLKRYDKAAVVLQKAVALRPSPGSHLFLGLSQFRLGQFEVSARSSREVLKIDPRHREANLFLIHDESALGRLKLVQATRVLNLFGEDVEVNYAVGQVALDRVRQIARHANDEGPGAEVPLWLNLRKHELNDPEAAARLQAKLKALGSHRPPPLVHEYDQWAKLTEECFSRVIETDRDSSRAHTVFGYLLEARNQTEQALQEYDKAGDHFAAGRLLAQTSRFETAEARFRSALTADPQNHRAMADLARLFVQRNQNEKALPLLKLLLKQYPNDASAWVDLGKIQQRLEQFENAVKSYQTAVRLDPSLYSIHYQLAGVYPKLGRLDDVKRELEAFEAGRNRR